VLDDLGASLSRAIAANRGVRPIGPRCPGLARLLGRTRILDSHASRLRRKLDPEAGRHVVN